MNYRPRGARGPLLLGAIADRMGLTTAFFTTSLILLAAMFSILILAKETVEVVRA